MPRRFVGAILLVIQDILRPGISGDLVRLRLACGTGPVEQMVALEVLEDLAVLVGGNHGIMRIHAILLKVVRQRPQKELVEHAPVVHIQIVLHLVIPPVGQVARVIVDGIMPVAAHEADGVRQHHARDGVRRRDADPRDHGGLVLLGHDAGVELDEVRVIV